MTSCPCDQGRNAQKTSPPTLESAMQANQIESMTANFESCSQHTDSNIAFWLARDLQHLLGYTEWRNFTTTAISKAKTACELSGHAIADHFVDVNKMVQLGSGSQREVEDLMLTRYACYLIAQNGDSKKQQIAFAQTYFALQSKLFSYSNTHCRQHFSPLGRPIR
jgi:DNA-damage-inducible protein D